MHFFGLIIHYELIQQIESEFKYRRMKKAPHDLKDNELMLRPVGRRSF